MEYLTAKGLKQLKDKVDYLKNIKRPEIAERINAAKELGDLSENAEYVSAKEEQGLIEAEVRRLENTIKLAVVVTTDKNSKIVTPGACVTVEINKEKKNICLVNSESVSADKGRISLHSPLGEALINHQVGEIIAFHSPSGEKKIKILEIKQEE
jgi:transcription elongation factor GreA